MRRDKTLSSAFLSIENGPVIRAFFYRAIHSSPFIFVLSFTQGINTGNQCRQSMPTINADDENHCKRLATED
jgi:hypothetical protein